MAQAAIFVVLALFFVTVAYAVPTRLEHEEVTADDIINALDMGIITNFHTIISVCILVVYHRFRYAHSGVIARDSSYQSR
jgi:hypothetical protein